MFIYSNQKFLGFAIHHNFKKAEFFMIATCICWGITIYYAFKHFMGNSVYKALYAPMEQVYEETARYLIVRL